LDAAASVGVCALELCTSAKLPDDDDAPVRREGEDAEKDGDEVDVVTSEEVFDVNAAAVEGSETEFTVASPGSTLPCPRVCAKAPSITIEFNSTKMVLHSSSSFFSTCFVL
jgi:hypothetical protein